MNNLVWQLRWQDISAYGWFTAQSVVRNKGMTIRCVSKIISRLECRCSHPEIMSRLQHPNQSPYTYTIFSSIGMVVCMCTTTMHIQLSAKRESQCDIRRHDIVVHLGAESFMKIRRVARAGRQGAQTRLNYHECLRSGGLQLN